MTRGSPLPPTKVTMVTRIADIDIKLSKLKNKWKGDQGSPPLLRVKKVTMVTRSADIDLKLCKLKNKWKGDQGPVPP